MAGGSAAPFGTVSAYCSSPAELKGCQSVPIASGPASLMAVNGMWRLAAFPGDWQSPGQAVRSLPRAAKREVGPHVSVAGSVLGTHLLLLLPQSWQR